MTTEYKRYCEKIYEEWKLNEEFLSEDKYYINKLIKVFYDKGCHKNLTKCDTIPLKQYSLYKLKKTDLQYWLKKKEIASSQLRNYEYEYSSHDNNLTEYLKQLYSDKKNLNDYVKSRKYIMNKNIVNKKLTPMIKSFLEYDRICMIVRDIRAGVEFS